MVDHLGHRTDTLPVVIMFARTTVPTPELVAYVRRRYAAGDPVDDIKAESGLSLGVLYRCLDGVYDDGSGLPAPALPRRHPIRRRRVPLAHVRATMTGRLWRAAESHVMEIEKRLARDDRVADEREGDARVFATMVRAMRDLKEIDPDVVPPQQLKPTPATEDDDPVPRDIDEFRRRIAEKIDRLVAADAAAAADDSQT
jgi:hypothetical protein